jgi:hypothetical protein
MPQHRFRTRLSASVKPLCRRWCTERLGTCE